MLIPVCLKFALPGAYPRFADLGRAIGVAGAEDQDRLAAEKFLEAVIALTQKLDIPTLQGYGIDPQAFCGVIDKMAEDAMTSGSPQNTIREITKEDVVELYKECIDRR